MTTPRNLILLTFIIGLYSCNTKSHQMTSEENSVSIIKNLAGQVYFFAPEFDSTTCEVSAACDCCTEDILFLNNSNFIHISYCLSEEQVFKGTYKIDNDKVYLKYDSLNIHIEYNWIHIEYNQDMKIDTIESAEKEYIINLQKTNFDNIILTAFTCNGQVFFKTDYDYGLLNKENSIDTYIQRLKDLDIWDKLNLNNLN